jgi:hypothetical protein
MVLLSIKCRLILKARERILKTNLRIEQIIRLAHINFELEQSLVQCETNEREIYIWIVVDYVSYMNSCTCKL